MPDPCLPNFFIVGAAKAGTTSLVKYLAQHPDIFMPELKEPKYFSHQDNIFPHNGPGDGAVDHKVIKDFDRYLELFEPGAKSPARGEASVDYLFFDNVPRRIQKCVPEAVIFIILRNPIDRAFSAYMHMVRDGRENLSFEEAMGAEAVRRKSNYEFFWRYTELGLYSAQIERYLEVFHSQVFVLLYDHLVADPLGFSKVVFGLLGVDPHFTPDTSARHNISGRPKMRVLHTLLNRQNAMKSSIKPFLPDAIRHYMQRKVRRMNLKKEAMRLETRERLKALYKEDIDRLEQMLGTNLGHWLA